MGKNKDVVTVLAVRNDRFGELLLTIPALRALKSIAPAVRLVLVVDPYVEELARHIDGVDEIITWPRTHHALSAQLDFIRRIRRIHVDYAVIFNPSQEMNWMVWAAGIPVRTGYRRKWSFLLTHRIVDTKATGARHEVECNLDLPRLIGAPAQDVTLRLEIPMTSADAVLSAYPGLAGKTLIAVHPWTSDPIKEWPRERFRELVARLCTDQRYALVIVGGRQESRAPVSWADGCSTSVIDLTGKTSLLELGALLKRCALLISADSGPVHLAASVGTPVIALFRNDIYGKTPRRWGPWGAGHRVIQKSDLHDISVDEVLEAVAQWQHSLSSTRSA